MYGCKLSPAIACRRQHSLTDGHWRSLKPATWPSASQMKTATRPDTTSPPGEMLLCPLALRSSRQTSQPLPPSSPPTTRYAPSTITMIITIKVQINVDVHNNDNNNDNDIAFQLMMSWVYAGRVLSLQSSLSCASPWQCTNISDAYSLGCMLLT